MKKFFLVVLAVLVIAGFTAADSEATLLCYSFDGFSDIVKISVSSVDGQKVVAGSWYAPLTYNFPAIGSVVKDSLANKIYGVQIATNGYIGLQQGVLNIVIDPVTKNGTYNYYMTPGPLTGTGTLTKISCVAAPKPFSTGQSSIEAALASQ
jgi:hypothetical protein